MKTNLQGLVVPSVILLLCLPGTAAPSPAGWESVDLGTEVQGDVRVLIQSGSGGYQVFFKNFGTTTVHFGFYIEGLQTSNSISANGRVHLKPGGLAGPLKIQPEPGAQGTIRVQIVECAVSGSTAATPSAS